MLTSVSNHHNNAIFTSGKKNKPQPHKTTDTNVLDNIPSPMNYNNSHKAFYAGLMLGLISGCGGAYTYDQYQTHEMIEDMRDEMKGDYVEKVGIEDLNDDGNPEIILYSKDGSASVYDMKNKNIYIKFEGDDELTEKLY